jgi:hypothetical protein
MACSKYHNFCSGDFMGGAYFRGKYYLESGSKEISTDFKGHYRMTDLSLASLRFQIRKEYPIAHTFTPGNRPGYYYNFPA